MKKKCVALVCAVSMLFSVSTNALGMDDLESGLKAIQEGITQLIEDDKSEDKEPLDLSTVETSYTLTAGNYTAGVDIPEGICNVTAVSGQGNIYSTNLYDGGINEMFGVDDGTGYYTESFNGLKLPDEVVLSTNGLLVVQLEYTEITEEPSGRTYDEAKAFELASGNYVSGKDFEPGTYNIVAVSGTGNLYSSNLYDGGINEMFGIDDGTGFYNGAINNVSMPEDTELTVSGGLSIRMIPEKMDEE